MVFGLFEAGMPVLGLLLGHGLADSLGQAARWLGGAVLIAFGAVGLIRARREAGPGRATGRGCPRVSLLSGRGRSGSAGC